MDTDRRTDLDSNLEIAIWCITPNGLLLGRKLLRALPGKCAIMVSSKIEQNDETNSDDATSFTNLSDAIHDLFHVYDAHIFIFSTGIAVRLIKNLITHKTKDPAVVVVDDAGFFAVSLLSGHLGGANHLARDAADRIGAVPVITTATDVNGLPSIDMIAKGKDLYIQTPENIKHVNMAILKQTSVSLYDPLHRLGDELSSHLRIVETDADANVACTYEIKSVSRETLILRPRVLALGIGCNRNTPGKEVLAFVENTLKENNVSIHSACRIGTSDVKIDEAGLLETAAQMEIPIDFFSREELNSVEGVKNPSKMARKHLGVNSVCEAAAILASGGGKLIITKKKNKDVTLAVALMQ